MWFEIALPLRRQGEDGQGTNVDKGEDHVSRAEGLGRACCVLFQITIDAFVCTEDAEDEADGGPQGQGRPLFHESMRRQGVEDAENDG